MNRKEGLKMDFEIVRKEKIHLSHPYYYYSDIDEPIVIDEDILVQILVNYIRYLLSDHSFYINPPKPLTNKIFCEDDPQKEYTQCYTFIEENEALDSIFVHGNTVYLDPPSNISSGTVFVPLEIRFIPLRQKDRRVVLDGKIFWKKIYYSPDYTLCKCDDVHECPQSVFCFGKSYYKYK